MSISPFVELQGPELWRCQCARNLMDCYALAMETSMSQEADKDRKVFDVLTRLMVDGMTSVRSREDEAVFYPTAADSCRRCAEVLEGSEKGRLFRIYAAIFEDMSTAVL